MPASAIMIVSMLLAGYVAHSEATIINPYFWEY